MRQLLILALALGLAGGAPADELKAGPLTLEIYVSPTATVFHVVDQLSGWSQFCHGQYRDFFAGSLTPEDERLLAEHARVRQERGWGEGLEQTFYSPLPLQEALAAGVRAGHLTPAQAAVEERVLTHFAPVAKKLAEAESATVEAFRAKLCERRDELEKFAVRMAAFVPGAAPTVPLYLLPNPSDHSLGGGFNGGVLTVEVARKADVYGTCLHELFHAFVNQARPLLERTAAGCPGLDYQTLNEGLAYAYSPGMTERQDGRDPLAQSVARAARHGPVLKGTFSRYNAYALALRPLLEKAWANPDQTLESLLPEAATAWEALVAADKLNKNTYKNDPKPSVFVFGGSSSLPNQAWARQLDRHYFQRLHKPEGYADTLDTHGKPGDAVVLLLTRGQRLPEAYADLLPAPWAEIEARLQKGEKVVLQGQARGMTVYLLGAAGLPELEAVFTEWWAQRRQL